MSGTGRFWFDLIWLVLSPTARRRNFQTNSNVVTHHSLAYSNVVLCLFFLCYRLCLACDKSYITVRWLGFRGSGCRTGCVSATCARTTASAAVALTSAIALRTSASTAGTGRRARRSATVASSTRTASASGATSRTARGASSAASAPTSCSGTPPASGHLLSRDNHQPSPTTHRPPITARSVTFIFELSDKHYHRWTDISCQMFTFSIIHSHNIHTFSMLNIKILESSWNLCLSYSSQNAVFTEHAYLRQLPPTSILALTLIIPWFSHVFLSLWPCIFIQIS